MQVWRIYDEQMPLSLFLSPLVWLVPLRAMVDRINIINLRDRSSQQSIVIPSWSQKNLECKEGGAATAAEMRVFVYLCSLLVAYTPRHFTINLHPFSIRF